jgi:hypothetical protein
VVVLLLLLLLYRKVLLHIERCRKVPQKYPLTMITMVIPMMNLEGRWLPPSVPTDTGTIGDFTKTKRAVGFSFQACLSRSKLTVSPAHPYPNDKKSADNEAIAHAMFLRLLDNKPYIAPIEEPKNIVDLGTGTGLWASLIADWFDGEERPRATVKGVDLAPQQESSVQPNLEFELDDITKDWTSNTLYDLVHIRMLWGVIGDWPKVYAESFK